MLPDPDTLVPFVIAVVVIALTPGPDMAFFLGRAINQGRAAGLAAMAGASAGILVHTTLVALGLSALILTAPTLFLALKLAGAAYLGWLAVQAVRHGSALTLPAKAPAHVSLGANFASGMAINLLNPKIVLFFMTFLPQFVQPGNPDASGQLVVLGLLFIAVALCITIPMILAADQVAVLFRDSPRLSRALDWLFASVFAAFAVHLLRTR
jgi:threonine/homoserine/homoserine lactone efflux protein